MSHFFTKRESLKTTLAVPNSTLSVEQLEYQYYASKSGLSAGTLADHKAKTLRDRLVASATLTADEANRRSLRRLERDYFISLGAVGASVDAVSYDFFTRIGLPA